MAESSQAPPPASSSTPSRYRFDSRPVANPLAIVQGSQGDSHWRFSLLDDVVLRYEWSPDGAFEDRASTFALFRHFDAPAFETVDTKTHLCIRTSSFELRCDRTEFSPTSLQIRGRDRDWRWQYDGQSYGDLGGTTRTLDGVDGRMPLAPGLASRLKPYSVLDDSESMLFEANGWIGTRKPGRKDGYFFLFGTRHANAVRFLYALSGAPPLLPRWVLGNWWSRYHEYSGREYLALMDKFQQHQIPFSVGVIDMDWHLVDIPSKYGTGWTGYTWNEALFPDPEAFLTELHKRGLRVALNDHPADGVRSFEQLYEKMAEALGRDTSQGEAIDFDCCDREFMDAYFDVLKARLEDQGVDFWWIDWQQGDESKMPGVDPLWVLNHFHFLTSMRNAKTLEQPMTFSRYAGPGSHRYPVGFSGDTVISWESLQFQPEFTATASNIGYGWWSHDIGGHWGGLRSNELTARWVQLGCFSPVLRLHSTKNPWNSKEPWNFEPETERIMSRFLRLRHCLIPFLYTMSARATYDGEPLVQPLYWKHADRPDHCYSYPNQYYFGPNLLVAPITQPTSPCTLLAAVPVWLPGTASRYVDLLRPSLVYTARDRPLLLHRPLSTLPVLAPEGTILVLDAPALYAPPLRHGVARPTALEIWLVVGASGTFTLVEEPTSPTPAISPIPPRHTLSTVPIAWDQPTGTLTIGPASHPPAPKTARAPGAFSTVIDLGTAPSEWLAKPGERYQLALGEGKELNRVDIEAWIGEVIRRAETPYAQKDEIWEVVMGDATRPVGERVRRLWAMEGVDEALKGAVMEVWASDGRAEGNAVGWEVWKGEEGEVDEDEGLGWETEDGYYVVSESEE
ncbi:hydrolase-like protein [Schizothecium vesticola]|uniref:alpha-glucosidase n=1 Tax=Schizothecium vesticola TaxID=314040 RepID=A0AA40EWS6_9PEZI|nr:hydrolase-like protein [Schizothecium vesticola]